MISETIIRKIQEMSEEFSLDPNYYLLDKLFLQDLDPTSKARELLNTSKQILHEAEEKIKLGDLPNASYNIWSACTLALKAHAIYKSKNPENLWEYKTELEKEIDPHVVDTGFTHAIAMLFNSTRGWAPKHEILNSLKKVEKLIQEISTIIE